MFFSWRSNGLAHLVLWGESKPALPIRTTSNKLPLTAATVSGSRDKPAVDTVKIMLKSMVSLLV